MPRTIAILGGTGAEGRGLALRFAHAGATVLVGSRELQKAQEAAARIHPEVVGLINSDAAARAEIAILTVPLQAQIATLSSVRESLKPGTVLVDTTVPLEVAIGGRRSHPLTLWAGSAGEQAARYVSDGVSVVSAFHSLSADLLGHLDSTIDTDVLICGDSAEAKAKVTEIIAMIPGTRAVDAGPLENARLLEHAAALLISLNLRHKSKHGGIRITGLEPVR